jgi:hypothetical protein
MSETWLAPGAACNLLQAKGQISLHENVLEQEKS